LAEETNHFLRTGFRDGIAASHKDVKDFKFSVMKTPCQRRRLFTNQNVTRDKSLAELSLNSQWQNDGCINKNGYE
jgi:hypothetical protein